MWLFLDPQVSCMSGSNGACCGEAPYAGCITIWRLCWCCHAEYRILLLASEFEVCVAVWAWRGIIGDVMIACACLLVSCRDRHHEGLAYTLSGIGKKLVAGRQGGGLATSLPIWVLKVSG